MENLKVKIKKLNERAILPTYGSPYAAGADLYACIDEDVTVEPHKTVFIKTGLSMEIPVGFAAFIYDGLFPFLVDAIRVN